MPLNLINPFAKGLALTSPKSARPSSARLREALLNMLQHNPELQGNYSCMLDLCAGSGAVGLDLLGVIAKHVMLVENNPDNQIALKKNIAKFLQSHTYHAEINAAFIHADAYKLHASGLPQLPELIFTDPPYQHDIALLYNALHENGILSQCRLLILQTAPRIIPALPITAILQRDYGNARLHFYRLM